MPKYLSGLLLPSLAVSSVRCVPSQPSVDPSLPRGEQAALYVEWLRHIDPHVTFQGQQRLRDLGEDAVPALTEALHDRDECVRLRAAQVLREIRASQGPPARTGETEWLRPPATPNGKSP